MRPTKRELVCALAVFFCLMVTIPARGLSRGISYAIASQQNLKRIITPWLLAGFKDPSIAVDASSVRKEIPCRLSARTDQRTIAEKYSWHDWSKRYRRVPALAMLPAALVLCAKRRRMTHLRRAVLVMLIGATVATGAIAGISYYSGWFYPGSLDYFDDYVYASGIRWDGTMPSDTMIAYEKDPPRGGHRVVGFIDGHVTRISEQDFQRLSAK